MVPVLMDLLVPEGEMCNFSNQSHCSIADKYERQGRVLEEFVGEGLIQSRGTGSSKVAALTLRSHTSSVGVLCPPVFLLLPRLAQLILLMTCEISV